MADKLGPVTLEEVKSFRQYMYDKSMALVTKKSMDYNRDSHEGGDTLFNIRCCEILGIVPTAERGILVRLMDKFMRLNSLVHPDRSPANTEESVEDTAVDIHNYVDYMVLLHKRRANMTKIEVPELAPQPQTFVKVL